MENIEFSHVQLSLAGKISVSQKNNILTDRIILQISGRKQISAQTVINGTTVGWGAVVSQYTLQIFCETVQKSSRIDCLTGLVFV